MIVSLYKKPIANKTKYSLFLQITGGGKAKKEYLKLYLYKKPRTIPERQHNIETADLAESIRSKRQLQLNATQHGVTTRHMLNADYLQYFEAYIKAYKNADRSLIKAVFEWFKKFLLSEKKTHTITGAGITVTLCEDFGDYLKKSAGLRGETPSNYFKKFRKVLIRAGKEGVVAIQSRDIRVHFEMDRFAIKKPILTPAEVAKLAATPDPHDHIRRAFLLSLNTGIDYSTCRIITWGMIDNSELVVSRPKKKDKLLRIPLNETALKLLGEPAEDPGQKIFNLPGHGRCLDVLRRWAKKAELDKLITWHSARHTLGTNMVNEYDEDLYTVKEILGHGDIRTTMKYSQLKRKVKQAAVDKLPTMDVYEALKQPKE